MRLGRGDRRRPRSIEGIGTAVAIAALVACAPAPGVGERKPAQEGPAAPPQSFAKITQDILVPRCATAACHAGESAAEYPPLDAEVAFGALVGAPSLQVPMDLVKRFDPANSYLVLKLRGTAGDVGGVPSPMPVGDAALDEADIQAIEAWIANGAPND